MAKTNWCVDPVNGSNNNAGDSWATTKSGTGVLSVGNTHLSDAAGGFTGTENKLMRIKGYMNFKITSVVSDTEVVLHAAVPGWGAPYTYVMGGALLDFSQFNGSYTAVLPGDEVRVAKTAYSTPVLAGDLTWTNKSKAITFDAGRIKVIEQCESGWVAGSADVTLSYYGNGNYILEGTNCLRLQPAYAFTTGKMAYKTLAAPLDLSAFQGISFGLKMSNDYLRASYLRICLCSDATGDTVVDELLVPHPVDLWPATAWYPMRAMRTGGGNLGATINSIAVYAMWDMNNVPAIDFDNFVAIKDYSSADHLCHGCMLSKTTTWPTDIWGITCFTDDTTITLSYPYYGATEAIASHRREIWPCPKALPLSAPYSQPYDTSNPIHYSGGWNPADGLQDGLTCYYGFQYANGITYILSCNGDFGIKLSGFLLGMNGGMTPIILSSSSYITLENLVISGFMRGANYYASPFAAGGYTNYDGGASHYIIKHLYIVGSHYGFPYNMSESLMSNYYRSGQYNWYMEDVKLISSEGMNLGGFCHLRAKDIGLYYYGTASNRGVRFPTYAHDVEINNLTIKDCGPYAISFVYGGTDIRILNLVTSDHSTAAIDAYNADLKLFNPSIAEATKVTNVKKFGRVARIKDGGVADAHVIDTYYGQIVSETTVRHTASGIAWKLSPTNTAQLPLQMRLAVLAVKAGIEIQVGVWLRRTNTGLAGRMFIPGGYIGGIATEQTVSMADSADVYRQYTLTLTPTEAGTIEVWVEARGGTTYSLYVDDFSVV